MPIDISNLSPSPNVITSGVNNVTINWQGIADAPADNNVSLELFVDPLGPLYILDNGIRVKSLKWSQAFPIGNSGPLSKALLMDAAKTELVLPVSCSLRLEATSQQGYKTAKNSHIILK